MVVPPRTIVPPNTRIQLVDPKTGILTVPGQQLLQQIWAQIVPTNQLVPCTADHTLNAYALSIFPIPPTGGISFYADYAIFTFVSPFTSTGLVTASVNDLDVIKVYKSNGAAQADAGDIVSGSLYLLIYNSALDTGNGGFVLK